MTVRDLAGRLNVAVYRLAQRGELPDFEAAGAMEVKPSDLDEWIGLQERAGAGQAVEGDKA